MSQIWEVKWYFYALNMHNEPMIFDAKRFFKEESAARSFEEKLNESKNFLALPDLNISVSKIEVY